MVAVRIGTGELDDYNLQLDGDWSVVPREGEQVIFSNALNRGTEYTVRKVAYQVGPGENLVGVMVLI